MIKTFYIADVGFVDDVGFYPKKDSYKHEASQIKFDNPDLEKFPRFKDVEWQRFDLTPGDGRFRRKNAKRFNKHGNITFLSHSTGGYVTYRILLLIFTLESAYWIHIFIIVK